MIGALERLHRDRGAQGLVFAALVLFLLVAFLASVVDLGALLEARIRHQGAADAAAYSGAVVRAQGLATIAAMNHVLVWLARAALGLVAAVVTLGVLVALNAVFPGAFAWAVPLFSKAVSAAVEWLPRLRSWSDRLARAEDRLAKVAPLLAAAEVDRIARANGAAHGLALPPASPLPISPEGNLPRFLDRVTGGVVPAWAAGRLFGNPSGSFSRSHAQEEGSGRFRRTRSATKTDANLGEGVTDPATRGKLSQFQRMMKDLSRNPWPVPRILDRRFRDDTLTVAAFPSSEAFRPPLWEETFPAPKTYPFVATARPFHPGLGGPGAEDARDNLYLIEGWSAELVPVDLKPLRKLGLPAEHLKGLEH